MARRYVVEFNPSLEYLTEVVRELRWKAEQEHCRDPYLQRIFEQRKFRHVWGDKSPWSFRFDVSGRKHQKGPVYMFFRHGLLWKADLVTFGKREPVAEVEILGPTLEELSAESLHELLQQLAVLEVMGS